MVIDVDAATLAKAKENLGKTYITGRITAIDADNLKLTVMRTDNVSQVIAVDDGTSFQRGNRGVAADVAAAGGMAGGGFGGRLRRQRAGRQGGAQAAAPPAPESITLADIKVGDAVMATGTLKGGTFTVLKMGVSEPGAGPGAGRDAAGSAIRTRRVPRRRRLRSAAISMHLQRGVQAGRVCCLISREELELAERCTPVSRLRNGCSWVAVLVVSSVRSVRECVCAASEWDEAVCGGGNGCGDAGRRRRSWRGGAGPGDRARRGTAPGCTAPAPAPSRPGGASSDCPAATPRQLTAPRHLCRNTAGWKHQGHGEGGREFRCPASR